MDNLPQVRVDIQHLFYYASSDERRRRRWWPFASSTGWRQWRWLRGPWSVASHDDGAPEPSMMAAAPAPNGSSPSSPVSSSRSSSSSSAGGKSGEKAGRAILQDISLSFTPGQLLGLMGPSGSGKTSLLRVLHGASKYVRSVQGTVLVNGTCVRNIHAAFRKMCSFVPQEDVLLPNFTVYQTLLFGARLRLPQAETREQRRETVEKVIQELGLSDCRDVVVGGVETAGGISGGQRRRVSIGLELLTDPSVLLLDVRTRLSGWLAVQFVALSARSSIPTPAPTYRSRLRAWTPRPPRTSAPCCSSSRGPSAAWRRPSTSPRTR